MQKLCGSTLIMVVYDLLCCAVKTFFFSGLNWEVMDNNNDCQRRSSRFLTISSLRQ